MKAFEAFRNMDPAFWAFVKFVSENLGYTSRGEDLVKAYSREELVNLCLENGLHPNEQLIHDTFVYSSMRANLLNNFVESMLMSAEIASREFQNWERLHRLENYYCKIPMNKQRGEMRQVAFFTAIINILAERTIREITGNNRGPGFDDDPGGLTFIHNNGYIIGSSSRRFDGAFPSIYNPRIVWEIKEYYYATTFGSRVADGVYETQLDGFELNELLERTGIRIYHVLFIDAYQTWWTKGKSYLCRLVDALNSGYVDEVIVGREVLERWPELIREIYYND